MIFPSLSFEDYRKLDAYGSSDIRAMRVGPPAMVPWRRANPHQETDATRLGTAAHCAIIEGDAFQKRFAFKPEGMSFATKEGKAWRASQGGRSIVSHDESERICGIVAAFKAKTAACRSLDSLDDFSVREASIVWPSQGVALKGRPDWYDGTHVYDLKITRHANERSAAFRAWSEGWSHQLAHYRAGLAAEDGVLRGGRLVLINPEPPHSVYLLEVKPDTLDLLALENEAAVRRIAECEASGVWPGTPEEWTRVDLPAAALAEVGGMFAED